MWARIVYATRSIIKKPFSKSNLLVTNTVSGGGLLVVGDWLQQLREREASERRIAHDWARSGRMFVVGLSQGPPHHYWYLALDRILPGRGGKQVCLKILADQLFAAPFFAISFIYVASLLEGAGLSQCWQEFKEKFPTIYLFDWLIWPPSQAINFLFIPSQYRVLYVNLVTVIWDVFLSYMKHKPDDILKESLL